MRTRSHVREHVQEPVPGEVAVDEGDGGRAGGEALQGVGTVGGAPQAEAVLVGVRGGDGRWDEGGDRRADPAEEDGDVRGSRTGARGAVARAAGGATPIANVTRDIAREGAPRACAPNTAFRGSARSTRDG